MIVAEEGKRLQLLQLPDQIVNDILSQLMIVPQVFP